tara:strand:- start:159 stop:563 length:405 start_codon:yes stop_codon:yes gene_type:complete
MDSIIKLYQSFSKYKKDSYTDLYYHIQPSINLNQYKIFNEGNKIYGFVNWAFLSDSVADQYKKTGTLYKWEWQTGKNLWLYDIIIKKNSKQVMSWVYNYFKEYLKVNQSIHWLRLDTDNNVYRIGQKFKREFHG